MNLMVDDCTVACRVWVGLFGEELINSTFFPHVVWFCHDVKAACGRGRTKLSCERIWNVFMMKIGGYRPSGLKPHTSTRLDDWTSAKWSTIGHLYSQARHAFCSPSSASHLICKSHSFNNKMPKSEDENRLCERKKIPQLNQYHIQNRIVKMEICPTSCQLNRTHSNVCIVEWVRNRHTE